MARELRTPTDEDWPAVCRTDGYAFGVTYTPEMVAERRPFHDLSRFRIVVDNGEVLAVAGSYAFDATLPGGTCVPIGGVTWVASLPTHRRQGLMTEVVEGVHRDIDDRGEPLAALTASESGIYGRLGYGVATTTRVTTLDRRRAVLRPEFRHPHGQVTLIHPPVGDDVDARIEHLLPIWDRARRSVVGELSRDETDFMARLRVRPGDSPKSCLMHEDGYALYTVAERWNDGHVAHTLDLVEFVAATHQARVALWQTLLGMDLIGTINSRCLSIDDPLPYLLTDPRALRTVELNDGVWLNVRDVALCLGSRHYRINDRLVVEVDGRRWQVEAGNDGSTCRSSRAKADITTDRCGLGSLLYGGVSASSMAAAGRVEARSLAALERADALFGIGRAPHCQTPF